MKILACFTVLVGSAAAFSACGGNVVVDVGGTTTDSGTTSTTLTTGTTTTVTTGTTGTTTTGTTTVTTGTTTTGTTTTGTTTTGTTTTGTTTTGTTTTGTTGPCGNWQYSPDPACQSCADQTCCGQLAACAPGTACSQLLECITLCPNNDAACFESCGMSGMAAGFDQLQALFQCVDSACAQVPGCASGGLCQSGIEHPSPTCNGCLSANCCGQFQACMNDLGTPASQPCGDCILGVAANPAACDADPLYNAAITCESTVCVHDCAAGICDTGLTTNNPPCDACLSNACCSAVQACVNDPAGCLDKCLLTGMPDADCDDPSKPLGALVLGIKSCWDNSCTGPSTCDGGL